MASILKSHHSGPQSAERAVRVEGVSGFNLDDFAEAGIKHLKAVEREAARILADAREEAERIKQQAHEEGWASGLQAAEKEVDRRVKADVDQAVAIQMPLLEAAVQQISDIEGEFIESFKRCLLGTALAAAERLVLVRLEWEPELLERWAEVAIGAAKTARKLVLAVHPETLVSHGERFEALLASPGLPEDTRIEADESVEPAGVVVRCEGGAVEMMLSQQLERLEEMLRGNSQVGEED